MKNVQNYTSAETSINENKLPAIYGKFEKWFTLHDCAILDYGCGKYTEHIRKWCEERNIRYLPYDPYNQDEVTNANSLNYAVMTKLAGLPVIGVCSNVLNVIDNDRVICGIIDELRNLTNVTFYTVYEGDKTGIGRVSKKDCWQRNEKLKSYLKFFRCYSTHLHHGMIANA